MDIELTTVGERGQAVIPKIIRDKMPAPKGTLFSVVMVDQDVLVLKRVEKKKLLADFDGLRSSILRKFSNKDIVGEIKKVRHA